MRCEDEGFNNNSRQRGKMKLNVFGKITKVALHKRKVLYFLMIILVFFSVSTYNTMTKSIFPEMKLPYISIATYLVGGSASEMEEMVTTPIENSIKDLKDIKKVTSSSGSGYSLVILQFNEGIDAELKVQQVQTKVNNIRPMLPKNIETPVIEEYDISKFPIIAVELNADMPYQQLKIIVDDLDSRLKSIIDIKSIDVQGLNKPYVSVVPKFEEMNKLGLGYETISGLIKEQQFNIPLGNRELGDMDYYFESDNRLTSLQRIEDIPLNLGENQTIKLSDIADISYENNEKLTGSFRIKNGDKKPIISLFVYKDPTGDTVAINKAVKATVAKYNETLVNKDQYGIRTSMDASEFIQTSINDVFNNALGGLLSVIAVLFLFINLRESILASLVIPVTMMTAFLMFNTFNLTLNVMSIMGLIIALGMLVDNAIVVIEMIDENKKHHTSMGLGELIIKSSNAVAPAIFSSTVTTVGAFIPLAFLSGADGALIRAIPIATALAMAVSFIVSITVTPVFAYAFIRKVDTEPSLVKAFLNSIFISILGAYAFSNQWQLTKMSYIAGSFFLLASFVKHYLLLRKKSSSKNGIYKTVISTIMRSKYYQLIVLLVMVSLFIYSGNLLLGGHIPMESMPKVDNKYLTGQVSLVKGMTEKDSVRAFDHISTYLSSRMDIEEYSADVGKDTISFAIELKNKNERDLHSEKILTELTSYVSNLPDIKGNFVVEGEEATSAPISITVNNDDSEQLFEDARRIQQLLERIPGTVSPRIEFDYGAPIVSIRVDSVAASRKSVDPSAIFVRIRELIAKEKIIKMTLEGVQTDIYLEPDNIFDSIEEMGQIRVTNSHGIPVLLKDVIIFEEQRNIDVINHEDYKKVLTIKSNLAEGFTVNAILTELEIQLNDSEVLALSTTYSIGGDFEEMEDSYSDLGQKFIIAALIVYVVLLIQFNGFLQPIAIIISVPFSIIGVAIGYYIGGLTFSTLSFLGIVSLVGIAVNDAIVLIDYINTLRLEKGRERVEAIIIGCVARFKPILATSLTTMAGVAPLALYSEDYAQMAYALIFGLFGSTILTLFVVPVVLNLLEGLSEKIKFIQGEKDEKMELG